MNNIPLSQGKNWLRADCRIVRKKMVCKPAPTWNLLQKDKTIPQVLGADDEHSPYEITKIPDKFRPGGQCFGKKHRAFDMTACGMSLKDDEGIVGIDTSGDFLVIEQKSDVQYGSEKVRPDTQPNDLDVYIPISDKTFKEIEKKDKEITNFNYYSYDDAPPNGCGVTSAEKRKIKKCKKRIKEDDKFRSSFLKRCAAATFESGRDSVFFKKGCHIPSNFKTALTLDPLIKNRRVEENQVAKELRHYSTKDEPVTIKRIQMVYHNADRAVPFVIEFRGKKRVLFDVYKYGFEGYPDCGKTQESIQMKCAKKKKQLEKEREVFLQKIVDWYKPEAVEDEK